MNEIERFHQFRANVEQWSNERGIYEHSTPLAQALKAVSEVGELADAVIKHDMDALKDAIGDVAVCLVNVAKLSNVSIDVEYAMTLGSAGDSAAESVGMTCSMVGDLPRSCTNEETIEHAACIDVAFSSLIDTASAYGFLFADCCDAAWNEIKDRKGRMVAGGAFVKEGV